MPNFSGIWTNAQQLQATGQGIWPAAPGAPTIGTAASASATSVSVPFTAPTCTGKYPAGVASYTATSTPGCFTASGASSPLTVTGLTTGTSYTFKVKAIGSNGLTSACSAASNSVAPAAVGQDAYTTAGTYSWVVPTGVTSVSVVAVGGGGSGAKGYQCPSCKAGGGGGGGALSYKNNLAVTPGESISIVVGAGGVASSSINGNAGSASQFKRGCTVLASADYGRGGYWSSRALGGRAACSVGDVKYNGGCGGNACSSAYKGAGGGGAAGYSGAGGLGGYLAGSGSSGCAGTGGSGGGGGARSSAGYNSGGGGGGVGILGQGSNGTAGVGCGTYLTVQGGGGSGGTSGQVIGCRTDAYYGGKGGSYGGGGGGGSAGAGFGGCGGVGAVRIIWPGTTRSFPSTCTGNL